MPFRLSLPPPASRQGSRIPVVTLFQRNHPHSHRSEAESWDKSGIFENPSWPEVGDKWGMSERGWWHSMDRSVVSKNLAHAHKAGPVPYHNRRLSLS